MQMTVKDLATHVLREINVIDYNETLDNSIEDGFFVLTRLVLMADLWQVDRLTIQSTERKTFSVAANTPSFTLGPGGVWNAARPEFINAAGFVDTFVNPTDPIETDVTLYTPEEWRRINLKTLTSTIIWGIWVEQTYSNTNGLSTVFVHPILTRPGTIALYYPIPWNNVTIDAAGLNTTLLLPPGYFNAILYNLAVDCCDGFEKTPTPSLVAKANRAYTMIKRRNVTPMVASLPKRLLWRVTGRGYNILTNQGNT